MISVLIFDGFSDQPICAGGAELSEICDIYIPLLEGILRYNGVMCDTVKPLGLEREYGVCGKNHDNIIYVPAFSYAEKRSSGISFIYTDSTAADSPSFRIASAMREKRSEQGFPVIFVNALHENDPLKNSYPIIVDNIRLGDDDCSRVRGVYATAVSTAESICGYYGCKFVDPAQAK